MMPWTANGVAISGRYAYVADQYDGLYVVDVIDPINPKLLGGAGTIGGARTVTVDDTFVFVSGSGSLVILPTQCDRPTYVDELGAVSSVLRLTAYPNPSSRETCINFGTDKGGPVQAVVYDLAGRRIRRLSDGTFVAGDHQLQWNGCDDVGREVPTGVYLVRVTTETGRDTVRFAVIR
jgi:hypothetical protein